ncbi:MAG: glycoside hydrolase family 127 protein [Acidimicrobiia bacterium]
MVRLTAVPTDRVELRAGFWRDRYDANARRGIPFLYEQLEAHGIVDNFRRLAGARSVPRRGFWFTDSDLYKWMEAAAWVGAPELDDVVAAVLAAQADDGYLNTNFAGDERFAHLEWSHELYCLGHFIQAAVARKRAQGREDLLNAAVRCADLMGRVFGAGKRSERDRHPVVEMALVELYRETGTARYLDLATFFCDQVPWHGWDRLWGHTVCALYFACGLTDVAIETGDEARIDTVRRWWADLVSTSTYVTGAVGGRWTAEAIGEPYELPLARSYTETCGAVAAAQWHARMLALDGDARAADALEQVLHNALLAGVSLAGDEWFYASPHATTCRPEEHPWIGEELPAQIAGPLPLRRAPWRDVTCCPPNVNRALATLPGQLYGTDARGDLWVHLFASSHVRAGNFELEVETEMPWSGRVTITIQDAPSGEASLFVREPAWSTATSRGRYREQRRVWTRGDVIELDLRVTTELLVANPRVESSRGSAAVRRGPVVYCFEGIDNPDVDDLRDLVVRDNTTFEAVPDQDRLGGITGLRCAATVTGPTQLYRPVASVGPVSRPVTATAIPYYAWANRGPSPMTVWLQREQAPRRG